MTPQNDLDQQLNAFLREGPTDLPVESFDAVRDRTEQTRQRVILGPWRLPKMNKLLAVGLGAVAVVAVLLVGSRFLGGSLVGGDPSPTATPSEAEPSSSVGGGLPEGPLLVFDPTTQQAPFDDSPPITVTIPAPGWTHTPENGSLMKGDMTDPPEGTGAFLLTGDSGADGLYVYGDPCHWESTTPDAPAITVDEIAAALVAQASRDATAPVDVSVGGYAGKSIILSVPDTGATPADAFKDCDQETFATYSVEGMEGPTRYQQGPGQVDEFWILDVDGQIVILDASYGPATTAELVDEIRAIAESATFEAP